MKLEWDRKASLEQRGINIITASGALVTLVFAVSAIVTKSTTFKFFRGWEHWLLVAALAFFVGASIGGIITNRAYRYRALDFPILAMWMRLRQERITSRFSQSESSIPWDQVEALLEDGQLQRAHQILVASSGRGPSQENLLFRELVSSLRKQGRSEEAKELIIMSSPDSLPRGLTATPPEIEQLEIDSLPMRKYNVLLTARYYNFRKAQTLGISMALEVIAIALVATSIIFLLAHA